MIVLPAGNHIWMYWCDTWLHGSQRVMRFDIEARCTAHVHAFAHTCMSYEPSHNRPCIIGPRRQAGDCAVALRLGIAARSSIMCVLGLATWAFATGSARSAYEHTRTKAPVSTHLGQHQNEVRLPVVACGMSRCHQGVSPARPRRLGCRGWVCKAAPRQRKLRVRCVVATWR
jgi:hypothetical protein